MKTIQYILLISVFLYAALLPEAWAGEAGDAISMSTFKRLTIVERLLSQQKYTEAQSKITDILNNLPSKLADRAYIYQTQAMLYLYQEQYDLAKKYLLLSYQQHALTEKSNVSVVQILADLSMHSGDYKQAITYLKEYLKIAEKPTRRIYLSLGVAYYQLKEFKNAISPLKTAMQNFEEDKAVHTTLFSVYYELKQLDNAAAVLEGMIKIWSGESKYWIQLASIYLQQKKYDQSLEVMQLAFTQNMLIKENEVLQFVYTLYEKGLPYKGALILNEAFQHKRVEENHKNLTLLATLYIDTRENKKALDSFKKSADYSKDGKDNLYIAQIYYDREEFQHTIDYAQRALDKGIRKLADAYMLMAVSFYDLNNKKKAKDYLLKASRFDKTRQISLQWLELIERSDG